MAAPALTEALDAAGVRYDVIPHEHTESAADEAHALGLPLDGVAKTLVIETAQGNVRALLPASERICDEQARRIPGRAAQEHPPRTRGNPPRRVPRSWSSARFRRSAAHAETA